MMIWISFLVLTISGPLAASEIHKCVDEEGNIAFQQTPCPAPVEAEPLEPTPSADVAAIDEAPPAELSPEVEAIYAERREPADVEACKIPHREAIDAIEADMLRGYSAEQGEKYKAELRGLTEKMRACE